MGTRGVWGFRIEDKDKVTYNHFNSYPSALGVTMFDFIQQTEDNDELKAIGEKLIMVDGSIPATPEQITKCQDYLDMDVSKQESSDWYCLLRKSQGQPSAYRENLQYMIDGQDFLADSLFCEYAYIVNLDTMKLELYEGFNKDKSAAGRYAGKTDGGESDYFGVKLVGSIDLDFVRQLQK